MRRTEVRPGFILRVLCATLLAAGLVGVGYWWGSGAAGPPPASPSRPPGVRPDLRVSASLLREMVTREAALAVPGLGDWERVNRLRDWAAAHSDLATKHALLDEDRSFGFYGRSAPEIFDAFFQDRGGVWCGGAAQALKMLYALFGFQADLIDYGRPGVMTHVVALVRITHRGTPMMVVEDPTFNLAYATAGGAPLDYFELLRILGRREHRMVRFRHGDRRERDVLLHPDDDRAAYPHLIDAGQRPKRILDNGVRKYASRLTLAGFERTFGGRIRAFLRGEGHPAHLLYLHLYPLKGTDQGILDEARRLTRRMQEAAR